MTTGDRHDLERPLTLQEAVAIALGINPHSIKSPPAEVHSVFVNEEQIWPAVPLEIQLHGTTPPPVLEVPNDPEERARSVRHREDQQWISKVTEGMRKDLKQLYEDRTNFVRREMGERLELANQSLRNLRHQAHVKDIELKRALETVGRQQIELEGLREQLDQQLRKEHR